MAVKPATHQGVWPGKGSSSPGCRRRLDRAAFGHEAQEFSGLFVPVGQGGQNLHAPVGSQAVPHVVQQEKLAVRDVFGRVALPQALGRGAEFLAQEIGLLHRTDEFPVGQTGQEIQGRPHPIFQHEGLADKFHEHGDIEGVPRQGAGRRGDVVAGEGDVGKTEMALQQLTAGKHLPFPIHTDHAGSAEALGLKSEKTEVAAKINYGLAGKIDAGKGRQRFGVYDFLARNKHGKIRIVDGSVAMHGGKRCSQRQKFLQRGHGDSEKRGMHTLPHSRHKINTVRRCSPRRPTPWPRLRPDAAQGPAFPATPPPWPPAWPVRSRRPPTRPWPSWVPPRAGRAPRSSSPFCCGLGAGGRWNSRGPYRAPAAETGVPAIPDAGPADFCAPADK